MVQTKSAAGKEIEIQMSNQNKKNLLKAIRDVPNFPKPGIVFKDITPLLGNPGLFTKMVDELARPFINKKIKYVVGIEARGFLLAAAMAYKLKAGLVPMRKKGKLPHKTVSASYALEYGHDTLEIHEDAFDGGGQVLIVDDVLATGGTAKAAVELVEKAKGKVAGMSFLIELAFLNGRKKLNTKAKIHSVLQFS